jgi:putative SOS response-associated peptidase YedK
MCYSAQVRSDYDKFVREFGALLSLPEFYRAFWERRERKKLRIPKAVDSWFAHPKTEPEREIKALIDEWNVDEASRLEQEIFKQRKRLADAERTLQTKTTKKAQDDQRIAGNKVEQALGKLADLKRVEPKDRDSRMFPGWYVPVLVEQNGQRIVRPMRYQCRVQGTPAFFDTKYPGTYNARRDSLEGFWKKLFGVHHGIMIVDTFYENVEGPDGKNQVIQFTPRDREPMLVACLWSHWVDPAGKEPDLLSFAAITDEPEPEVAAAGHDRTIINIKREHVDAWLNPEPGNLAALYVIFDDKRHPYYEHRLAA